MYWAWSKKRTLLLSSRYMKISILLGSALSYLGRKEDAIVDYT